MKIRASASTVIFLILLNLILFSAVIWQALLIKNNSLVEISDISKDTLAPAISTEVKNIDVNSKAFVIYDVQSRGIIASKNEHLRFSPASSAKIMTATIVLEDYDPQDVLSAIGVNSVEGSKMGLFEGEQMQVANLLYGLMLPSGNDAAYVLAANYNGGRLKFIAKMNERARELNMRNTYFVDPDGYDDSNYTTAFDLARLAAHAISDPRFAKIVSTKNIEVQDVSGSIPHSLTNLNELLELEGVTGIKTGFTEEAGGVLVTSIKNQGKTFIIVVLGSQDRFADTKNIIKNAIGNLRLVLY